MDISVLKGEAHYKSHRQYVTLQGPKLSAATGLKDSVIWLESVADEVFVVESVEAFPKIIEKALPR